MPEVAGAGKGDAPADPWADWTDDEKAEYAASEKFRKRHASEVADEIFERLFGTPEGGETVGPDGADAEPTPGAVGKPGAAAVTPGTPWFDRPLFSRKAKPPAAPAAPAKPAPAAKS
ncbi:MAG: hypothetical protein ABSC73_09315 [Acidimicrobiales bacterium]|jgi:hypothetical protein